MILKAMFWQLMDRDNRIRIPHPLPLRKQRRQCCSDYFCFPLVGEESQQAKNHQPPESEKLMVFRICGNKDIACTVKKYIA